MPGKTAGPGRHHGSMKPHLHYASLVQVKLSHFPGHTDRQSLETLQRNPTPNLEVIQMGQRRLVADNNSGHQI